MIKREFKVNLKSFVIWTSILIGMFLIVYLIYPYIINDATVKNMDELMKVFPDKILKAFNMDMTSISTAYGWFKTEGFMFVLIIVGIYSSILGSNIVLKEESNKTIEYLSSLPVTRTKIMTNKIIVCITYITLMVLLLGIFNYISLCISGEFAHKQFILISITPILIGYPLFAFNLFISTFLHKIRKTTVLSLGIVFLFYILNVISELSEKVEFIKYFSIYTLSDLRGVINNVSINPINIILSISITILFIILSYIRYNKKELI